ncbi:MAG: hypothetical protein WBD36_07280 [Bacteroidota bacterium]
MPFQRPTEKREAIAEAEKLQLSANHFYFVLLDELYTDIDNGKAKRHYQKALGLAKTQTGKLTIQKKTGSVGGG